MVRAFLAVPLPPAVAEYLGEIQERLKSFGLHLRWIRPENIHLTIKFLGDVRLEDTDRIREALSPAVAQMAFPVLQVRSVGVFPDIRRPRVLWAGVDDQTEALGNLQAGVEDRLARIGFKREARGFQGHLTLARVRDRIDSRKLAAAIESQQSIQSEPFMVVSLVLYKSDLKSTGAQYSKLAEFHLKGKGLQV